MAADLPKPIRRDGEVVRFKVLGNDVVEFCYHALQQMTIRGINKTQVLQAIRSPTKTGLATQMGRTRIRRDINRRKSLDVVYEQRSDRLLVITTFVKDWSAK